MTVTKIVVFVTKQTTLPLNAATLKLGRVAEGGYFAFFSLNRLKSIIKDSEQPASVFYVENSSRN